MRRSPSPSAATRSRASLGDPRLEHNGGGVRLLSAEDRDADGARAGEAACVLTGLRGEKGRWYRVRVRGLAQEGFAVDKDDLFLKVEFYKDGGKNPLDFVKKSLYPQVERDRTGLADAATAKNLGPATWRNYTLDVRTPFPEVDTLRVAVGFGHGVGKGARAEFWLAEVEVMPIPDPADYAPPAKPAADNRPPALKDLVRLGGRWYYDPRGGSKEPPRQFDHSNADRLLYLGDRLGPPFAGNTSAWLRRGYLDHKGDAVEKDRLVTDSLVVSFAARHLVVRSKNLPNHPTAVFPDRSRFLDGNPNLIQEQRDTWHIPLEPKENPNHVAMDAGNRNRALTVGPIGVAVNGVVFNNPYDIEYEEAIWRLDRCCGHPSPRRIYHYHKYPACVNTPWADDGDRPLAAHRVRVRRVPGLRPLRGRGGAGQGRGGQPAERLQPACGRRAGAALPRHARQVPPHPGRVLGRAQRPQLVPEEGAAEGVTHAISSPRSVPVLDANLSASSPSRWSMLTNRFGSG